MPIQAKMKCQNHRSVGIPATMQRLDIHRQCSGGRADNRGHGRDRMDAFSDGGGGGGDRRTANIGCFVRHISKRRERKIQRREEGLSGERLLQYIFSLLPAGSIFPLHLHWLCTNWKNGAVEIMWQLTSWGHISSPVTGTSTSVAVYGKKNSLECQVTGFKGCFLSPFL